MGETEPSDPAHSGRDGYFSLLLRQENHRPDGVFYAADHTMPQAFRLDRIWCGVDAAQVTAPDYGEFDLIIDVFRQSDHMTLARFRDSRYCQPTGLRTNNALWTWSEPRPLIEAGEVVRTVLMCDGDRASPDWVTAFFVVELFGILVK